jgi:C4-dicarboxylate transporter, DctQ subunit
VFHKYREKAGPLFDRVLNFLVFIDCLIIAFLMFLVTVDVIGRKLFGLPVQWVLEISELCIPAMVFLGAAWLLKNEGHITMDMVVNQLGPKGQAALNFFTSLLGIFICIVLTFYASRLSIDHIQRNMHSVTVLGLPTSPRYILIAFGFFLLIFQFVRRAYHSLKNWSTAQKQERLSESPF